MAAGNYRCILSLLTSSTGLWRLATNAPQRLPPGSETSAATRSCITKQQLKVKRESNLALTHTMKPLLASYRVFSIYCSVYFGTLLSVPRNPSFESRTCHFLHLQYHLPAAKGLFPREGRQRGGTIAVTPLKLCWTRNSSRYCHVTV